MPWVLTDLCAGCGDCVKVCQPGAIHMSSGKVVIDQEQCVNCGLCMVACPQEAIRPNSENSSIPRGMGGGSEVGDGRGFGMGRGKGFRRGGGGGGAMGR